MTPEMRKVQITSPYQAYPRVHLFVFNFLWLFSLIELGGGNKDESLQTFHLSLLAEQKYEVFDLWLGLKTHVTD